MSMHNYGPKDLCYYVRVGEISESLVIFIVEKVEVNAIEIVCCVNWYNHL